MDSSVINVKRKYTVSEAVKEARAFKVKVTLVKSLIRQKGIAERKLDKLKKRIAREKAALVRSL